MSRKSDRGQRKISITPTAEQVQANTGYPVYIPAAVPTTTAPTREQLDIIAMLDPHNQRGQQIKDNPPGQRS